MLINFKIYLLKKTIKLITLFSSKTDSLKPHLTHLLVVRIDCGEPEVDDTTTEVKSNGTSPGSVAEYTCLQQMEFVSGDSVRICQMTGRWDGLRPVCQAEGW